MKPTAEPEALVRQEFDLMALKVYKYGEKVLREKSSPVLAVDDSMRALADEMLETMHYSCGLRRTGG